MTEHPHDQAADPAPSDLAASMAGVVDAALGVGVSLARVMAEATALGKAVAPLPEGTTAPQAIVRYGVAAVGNLAQAVVSGAQGLRKGTGPGKAPPTASSSSPATPASFARAGGPKVHAGATLRVPLSVENPGDRPMLGLVPVVREVRCAGADASALLPASAVSFSPMEFDVAPHDFEKLVVQVSVPAQTPPAVYEIVLALGDDEPDLPMGLMVLPATA